MPDLSLPVWNAEAASNVVRASDINQFLATHPTKMVYQGTSQYNNGASSGSTNNTASQMLAQSFVTTSSQTAVTYVVPQLNGGPVDDFTVSLTDDNSGVPGTVIASLIVPGAWFPTSSSINLSPVFPFALTGLAVSTRYWLTLSAGTSSVYVAWYEATSPVNSGAVSTNNGSSWSSAAGLTLDVYDGNSGLLVGVNEDNGNKWGWFSYNANNTLADIYQNTLVYGGGTLGQVPSLTYGSGSSSASDVYNVVELT